MDEAAKRRLVGAAVLVALAVIFVPMLVEQKDDDGLGDPIVIPEPPAFESAYDASDLPTEQDSTMALPTPEPPGDAGIDYGAGPAAQPEPAAPSTARSADVAPPAGGSAPTSASTRAPSADTSRKPAPAQAASAVAGPKPVPDGVRSWVVQVASLGSPEAARTLQNELRAKGYPAFVEQARVSGKQYFRVRVGPELERDRADRLAKKLASETSSQPFVQQYP